MAIVLKGYPRISETFIAQEIRALEARGLGILIFSLRYPAEALRHPVHDEIRAPVHYLPEYLWREPLRLLRAWRAVRRLSGYRRARSLWLADLKHDRSASRVRRFGQALVLAAELPDYVRQLHAHFLHTPASVARYAALVTGRPWSCSAHAKDIWTLGDREKAEKLRDCSWLVTCTAANRQHLRALAAHPECVELVYHGLDFARFPPPPARHSVRDGRRRDAPVRLLSVGRAVPKKGYEDLLCALALLPARCHWRLVHVGAGPLRDRLVRQARQLGIAQRIEWRGACPQDEVLRCYREADLFVLPCRVTAGGDRDGLPNVLLEAQSQRLACISTRVSGIPELIEDGVTGMLVPERDVDALAAALCRLSRDPALRAQLAEAGFRRVHARFSLTTGIDRLAAKFGLPATEAA